MIFKSVIVLLLMVFTLLQRTADLPREIHGYKVQRARVELKQTKNPDQEIGEVLIRLGEPKLVGVSPLGVTFDLPVILAPVKQEGEIERLVFEAMLCGHYKKFLFKLKCAVPVELQTSIPNPLQPSLTGGLAYDSGPRLLGPRASLTGTAGLAYWDRGRLARREREALAASRRSLAALSRSGLAAKDHKPIC